MSLASILIHPCVMAGAILALANAESRTEALRNGGIPNIDGPDTGRTKPTIRGPIRTEILNGGCAFEAAANRRCSRISIAKTSLSVTETPPGHESCHMTGRPPRPPP